MASIVSERYALSLYEVAKEAGKAPELLDELLAVAQVFGENPDLMKVMQAPAIQLPEKKELLQTVFGGRIDGFLLNFLMLITEKRRIGLLYEMAESYKQQYYFEEGICEVTAITASIDGFLLNFLMLITEKRRIGLLYEMAESYKQQYYFEEGICEVTAITASPMDADLIEKLKEKMCSVTGKKVVLQTRVDPSILGGIVVKVDNKQIDTSVKTRLEELAQKLTQTIA